MNDSFHPIEAEHVAMLRAQAKLLATLLDDFSAIVRGFSDDATHQELLLAVLPTLRAEVFGEDTAFLQVVRDE